MEAYSKFAAIYDTLMDDVPYSSWGADIISILHDNNIASGIVAELGCGTGTMTGILADAGYDMIGIDMSADMLDEARAKLEGKDVLLLCQDMREFELYGTVEAIISVCDCVNYILDENELTNTFRLVNNYLERQGLFIFDFNTTHKYRDVIGDAVIAENREQCSFIWENEYDDEANINAYYLTLFIRNENNLYEKYEEEHIQRGYELEEIKTYLKRAGLEYVRAYDTDTKMEPSEETERITVIAREGYNPDKLYVEFEKARV